MLLLSLFFPSVHCGSAWSPWFSQTRQNGTWQCVFACRIPQKCAICFQVPEATTVMGSSFGAQTTPELSPAVVGTQSSEFSAGFLIPFIFLLQWFKKRFANVGQFCVDYLTGILAGSVIYAKCQDSDLGAPWCNGTHLPARASVGRGVLLKGKFLLYTGNLRRLLSIFCNLLR